MRLLFLIIIIIMYKNVPALCNSVFSDRLVGLVVKASTRRAADLGFDFLLRCGDLSESSHRSHVMGTPVATLPGA